MVLKFDDTVIDVPNDVIRENLERILDDLLTNYTWDWDPTATSTSVLELNDKDYTVPTICESVVKIAADFDPRMDFTADTTYNKLRNIVDKGLTSVGVTLKKMMKPTYDPNKESEEDKKIQGYIAAYQLLPAMFLVGGIILLQSIR